MHIAFYAPLKSPDHPVPSGDRLMARLLMQALRDAGHEVTLASEFRSYSASAEGFERRCEAGKQEARRLGAKWRSTSAPDLFFCYHPYYKSPDFLGPDVCREFVIPYVTAEASFSSRHTTDAWAASQALVVDGLGRAALNICITERDQAGLRKVVRGDTLARLPPFLDVTPFTETTGSTPPGLVTVAMMRPGDKLESYRMLAAALTLCKDLNWHLTIVGDGPCRQEVQAMFSDVPQDRVVWAGELSPHDVPAVLARCDLYVWPGFGEAYGLAYLEAQASGLPVVAQNVGGVPEVVKDQVTGLLTASGDVPAFAAAIRRLLENRNAREAMGAEARRFVTTERSESGAAKTLKSLLSRFEK